MAASFKIDSFNGFFFQGDMLLLPQDIPDSLADRELPLELAKDFNQEGDVFEIPVTESGMAVRGVSFVPEGALPKNWRGIPVRKLISMMSGTVVDGGSSLGRIIHAFHIAQWRLDSRFCGSCGTKNDDVSGEPQRQCPKCGRTEFPRISPAVIVIITDDEDRILLAHNKKFRDGVYSHISGFVDAGECPEETVVREIREEVNIEVRDIKYIRSQPWPFPNSLMLGFSARYSSGTIRPDGIEIEDARWFTRANLPELPGEGSLSRFLISRWLSGTENH